MDDKENWSRGGANLTNSLTNGNGTTHLPSSPGKILKLKKTTILSGHQTTTSKTAGGSKTAKKTTT